MRKSIILLLCPTSPNFMPYINLYADRLDSKLFLIWDRFNCTNYSEYSIIYRDKKTGHRRNIIDYFFFSLFFCKWIFANLNSGDRIVVFGVQILFFLWPIILLKRISFSLDYRDYHIMTKIIPSFVYSKSQFIAISSPSYSSLFPKCKNLVVSHNYNENFSNFNYKKRSSPIVISCIGAIRDFNANSHLISTFGNDNNYILKFHGSGIAVKDLKNFSLINGYKNVVFTGGYIKSDEVFFYRESSFINLLRDSLLYNDKVALPNRLYNAAIFHVPILCYEGTMLADYVKKYDLGVCVKGARMLRANLNEYTLMFDALRYEKGVQHFLSDIRLEQHAFLDKSQLFFKFPRDL